MRPLEGIQVLDLSRIIPGPYCSLLLADMGADVIKIEDPHGGDPGREMSPSVGSLGSRFLLLNRNKKSVALNLKDPGGRKVFLQMAEKADVVLEGFRPGTMAKFNLEYDHIRTVNPRIIYCSLSAFGQDGPYRDVVGHDLNVLGISGLLDTTRVRGGQPIVPGVTIADNAAAMFCALGIMAALLVREKTGRGRFLDICMLDSVLSWLFDSAQYQSGQSVAPGEGRARDGGDTGGFGAHEAKDGVFETKDGRYITLGSLEPKYMEALFRQLGEVDVAKGKGASGNDELQRFLRRIFVTRTQKEWIQELGPLNICFTPVNTIDEALSHPQVVARRMVIDVDDPQVGRTKVIGDPLKVSDPRVESGPAPLLGQDTREVLAGLGYSDEQIIEMERRGAIGTMESTVGRAYGC